jgi:spore coat polysaccharide biosynthesis protein SpsF (cytidylyltransferase family)
MSESSESFDAEDIWEYVKNNPKIVGIQVSQEKSLDLLSALADVYKALERDNVIEAKYMMTMLASVLVATTSGTADEIVNEIMIQESMETFDESIKEILSEG